MTKFLEQSAWPLRLALSIPVYVLGALVLTGSWLHVEILTSLIPGLPSASSWTATLTLILALSLPLGKTFNPHTFRLLAILCSSTVLGAALLSIAIRSPFLKGGFSPMSSGTTVLIVLVCVALLLEQAPTSRARHLSSLLLFGITSVSVGSAVAGFGAVLRPINPPAIAWIDLPIACAFAFFAMHVLLMQATRGELALLRSPALGGVIARRLLLTLFVIPTVALGLHASWMGATRPGSIQLVLLALTLPLTVVVWSSAALVNRVELERSKTEERLREMTVTDELTGLYNRRGFFQLGEVEISRARREHRNVTLLYMDVDNFKKINDGWGHEEGDRALRRMADVLKTALRPTDVLARFGGDEFTVMLTTGALEAEIVLGRLRKELQLQNSHARSAYQLEFGCGIAMSDREGYSLTDLLAAADLRLSGQKRRGPVIPHRDREEELDHAPASVALRA